MTRVDVNIMGQAYGLSCADGEEARLLEAVRYLDVRMNAIRMAGKVRGTDRIAVMAALGIAAELLASRLQQGIFSESTLMDLEQKVARMHEVLDAALTPQENLF